jgi:hypothetical protein
MIKLAFVFSLIALFLVLAYGLALYIEERLEKKREHAEFLKKVNERVKKPDIKNE